MRFSQIAITLIAFNFIANLANDIYLPSLPHLSHVFAKSENHIQLTMTAWFMGIAFPQLLFGALSEKFGKKSILLSGCICFIAATITCSFTTHFFIFMLCRFFQGVGICCLNVSSYSIFAELFSGRILTNYISMMNTLGSLSPLLGPIIGGHIFVLFGWEANFILIAFLSIICFIFLAQHTQHIPFTFNQSKITFSNILTNYFFLIKSNLLYKKIIPYCLLLGGLVSYITVSPLIFISVLHVSPQFFGYTQIAIFIAYLLGSGTTYLLHKDCLTIGLCLVMLSGIIMTILVSIFSQPFYSIIIAMMLYTYGLGLSSGQLIAEIVSSHIDLKNYTSALLGFSMAISCVLSTFILSMIYSTILSFALFILIISSLAFLLFHWSVDGWFAMLKK